MELLIGQDVNLGPASHSMAVTYQSQQTSGLLAVCILEFFDIFANAIAFGLFYTGALKLPNSQIRGAPWGSVCTLLLMPLGKWKSWLDNALSQPLWLGVLDALLGWFPWLFNFSQLFGVGLINCWKHVAFKALWSPEEHGNLAPLCADMTLGKKLT